MAARAGAADSRDAWLVADKHLIMSEIMIFPVRFCRQQSTLLLDCQHVICHRPYRAYRAYRACGSNLAYRANRPNSGRNRGEIGRTAESGGGRAQSGSARPAGDCLRACRQIIIIDDMSAKRNSVFFLTLSMRHPISVSQSSDSMRYAMLRSSCDV